MSNILKGQSKSRGKRYAIIVAQFNDFITKNLLEGCLRELSRLGVRKNEIMIAYVPGSFEIPVAALKFALKKNVDAVICLGAVIRGETLHYELVAKGAADGIAQVALLTGKPVIFGVLATDTVVQAERRSEIDGENKGTDAAKSAVEMVNLLLQIK
jgi:6,7-dimethyl-8-ribityllumazine synthase